MTIEEDERRLVSPTLREALWDEAANLVSSGGSQVDHVRGIVVALLEARRTGAREALLALAAKLDESGVKADVGLLRALADGYAAGWVEPGDYDVTAGRRR